MKENKILKKFEKGKSYKEAMLFCAYLMKHPEERFFQALCNWLKADITINGEDPFYWDEMR